jgi:hypothetical protein
MVGLPAISNSLQEIAVEGIKEDKRESQSYGTWFLLLILLASKGWNMSIEGEARTLPTIGKEFKKARRELGVTKQEIEQNFITTDILQIARFFSQIKEQKYPFDRRVIHVLEHTAEGNLRVYSEK